MDFVKILAKFTTGKIIIHNRYGILMRIKLFKMKMNSQQHKIRKGQNSWTSVYRLSIFST